MDPATLLPSFPFLSPERQQAIISQLSSIDLALLAKQRKVLKAVDCLQEVYEPFDEVEILGRQEDVVRGKKLLLEGKIGCLIAAGGQGTRLGYKAPKGFFPITLIQKKSLFQLSCERIAAAQQEIGTILPVAILTSKSNHQETMEGFAKNQYFGLDLKQLFFFTQEEIPLLDEQGHLFLEGACRIAQGADGNASALRQFVVSGIWKQWKESGICYVNYLPIDNPLADPFDAEFSGFHDRHGCEIAIKCVEKTDPKEKVGVLVTREKKVAVVEYSELSLREKQAKKGDRLKHFLANIGIYSFSIDFIQKIALECYDQLPLHKAWKSVHMFVEGKEGRTLPCHAWKFERFIFDVIPYANKVKALLVPRDSCFAPLKNAQGEDSIEQVQKALLTFDRKVFAEISGQDVSDRSFELDPRFYYLAKEVVKQWKGHIPEDHSYLTPFSKAD